MCANEIKQIKQQRQPADPMTMAMGGYPSGMSAYPRQTKMQQLSARLLEVQESERRRIATDLHDVLGQSLTVIKLFLDESAKLLAANKTRSAAESLEQVRHKVRETFGELRRVAMNLRPAIIDDLGILAALSWFFREFETACHDIDVEKCFGIRESDIPVPLKITIFRIVQEAANNIARHANASHARVILKRDGDTLLLTISDNGEGFDPMEAREPDASGRGLGLLGMRERAELSGGACVMESRAGHGTRISVSWPLVAADDGCGESRCALAPNEKYGAPRTNKYSHSPRENLAMNR